MNEKMKNMCARPGGISDDEESSDNPFAFLDEESTMDHQPFKYYSDNKTKSTLQRNHTYTLNDAVPNTCDDERSFESCVINACMMGHISVIEEYLYTWGVNDFLHTGWTPLLYAASCAQVEVIEFLLKRGADPNKHKDGYTPLMALCNSTKGNLERSLKSLALLLEAKANVNAANKLRETPLMFACKTREPAFIQELLKHVKCIDNCDNEGRTALTYAVIANKPEVVKILVENEANVTIKEKNDMTARDIAALKGYEQILSLLNCNEEDDLLELLELEKTYETEWKDMFPSLRDKNDNSVSYDVTTILNGMGLEKYSSAFQGIDLKTFLQLNEEDLLHLGVDISVHRRLFVEYLHKFHIRKWSTRSIGIVDKFSPYTIYDGVVSLGNAAKQIGVIGSSIRYIKNSFQQGHDLTTEQKRDYEKQLEITENTLRILKRELHQVKNLAEKIDKESTLDAPACYIEPKKKNRNWTVVFGISLIVAIYFLKTPHVQRLWHY